MPAAVHLEDLTPAGPVGFVFTSGGCKRMGAAGLAGLEPVRVMLGCGERVVDMTVDWCVLSLMCVGAHNSPLAFCASTVGWGWGGAQWGRRGWVVSSALLVSCGLVVGVGCCLGALCGCVGL